MIPHKVRFLLITLFFLFVDDCYSLRDSSHHDEGDKNKQEAYIQSSRVINGFINELQEAYDSSRNDVKIETETKNKNEMEIKPISSLYNKIMGNLMKNACSIPFVPSIMNFYSLYISYGGVPIGNTQPKTKMNCQSDVKKEEREEYEYIQKDVQEHFKDNNHYDNGFRYEHVHVVSEGIWVVVTLFTVVSFFVLFMYCWMSSRLAKLFGISSTVLSLFLLMAKAYHFYDVTKSM